ncbi:MAG: 16S rRNA (adenine(1518)-N(6)/adenine(1519)-N(6))-dimethyltransferase RsmA [Bacteroidales bacterium]|nr:16S rRNA (adenine(1518)-N(6)/adenine(1519)-N(6))-dimethyltransferase RsmA [Bacteroidales bacterium]
MVSPKKSLGQHFLHDKNIAQKIVDHLIARTGNVLEVGPGTGVLTGFLNKKNFQDYKVIEIDRESVEYLQKTFPELNEKILAADFLRTDIQNLFQGSFSVIGNFPYNISSQILFKILDVHEQVDEVVGMFQKEVAERIVSPPGSKKYGILSVLVQAFFNARLLFTVNESVFYPPPRVKSAVIKLERIEGKMLPCEKKLFFDLVKTAFNQRRKTLKNALHKFEFAQNDKITELLSRRAEQLSVTDFEYMCTIVQQVK